MIYDSTYKDKIRNIALSLHLDCFGAASLPLSDQLKEELLKSPDIPFVPGSIDDRLNTEQMLPGSRCLLVFLFPYKPRHEEKNANISLYARARDYHRIIRQYLSALIEKITPLMPSEKFAILADTSPLTDRWAAYAAGLGWYGRNHCLIHPKYGSYFTIGSIITTAALPADQPMKSSCGECRRCIATCPGQVLGKKEFSPYLCKSYLTQKKGDLSDTEKRIISKTPLIFGCDECQRVCPYNKKSAASPIPEIEENRISYLSLETLRRSSVRGFQREFKEYAFSWRGKKVLERNAEIIHDAQEKKD